MQTYHVEVDQVINAQPEVVYRVVSDMAEHREILPPEFEGLEVLQGGVGAGTVIRVPMKAMGARVTYILTISEPEPGRVLCETDEAAGVATTWTFTPVDGGARCHLKLESRFRMKPGVVGYIERLLTPALVRSIYRRELGLLEAHAQRLAATGRAG